MKNYNYPEYKEELYELCETAHDIAKKFLDSDNELNSENVYRAADIAVKLYSNTGSIQDKYSFSEFVKGRINYEIQKQKRNNFATKSTAKTITEKEKTQTMKAEKFTPISEEVRNAVIADVESGMTNAAIAAKNGISPSSVGRIKAKAGLAVSNNTAECKAKLAQENASIKASADNGTSIGDTINSLLVLFGETLNEFSFSAIIKGKKYSFYISKEDEI